MIKRPANMSAFEFVILSGLRAAQLTRGCIPRVEGVHKRTITAQMEVAEGRVVRAIKTDDVV
jgi:DNA-directed RNA polymerase subunit K/omega